jgi:hypothetical protein
VNELDGFKVGDLVEFYLNSVDRHVTGKVVGFDGFELNDFEKFWTLAVMLESAQDGVSNEWSVPTLSCRLVRK